MYIFAELSFIEQNQTEEYTHTRIERETRSKIKDNEEMVEIS